MRQAHLNLLLSLLVLILGLLIFGGMHFLGVFSDADTHNQMLLKFIRHGSFPVPPGYYAATYLLFGLVYFLNLNVVASDTAILGLISVTLLAAAWFAKFWVTERVLNGLSISSLNSRLRVGVLSLTLLLTAPIFYDFSNGMFYAGRVATNVWHNSTTIFVMPFVLLLFMESITFLKADKISSRNVFWILVFGLGCLLIKPSFLFTFIPSFYLIAVFRFGASSKRSLFALGLSTAFLTCILLEAYIIYYLDLYNIWYEGDKGSVVIAPFRFLNRPESNIFINMLVSFAFPLVYVALKPRDVKENVAIQFSFLIMFCALVIGVLFEESGARANHGNLFWQAIMANYVLFCVVSARVFLDESVKDLGSRKKNILQFVYALHVLSGIGYVINLLVIG